MDYSVYTTVYQGVSIPETDWPRISARAQAKLDRYDRIYSVTGSSLARQFALCAVADALYYFEAAANGDVQQSATVGSVSGSVASSMLPDLSPAAQERELLRCASLYLDICRG